MVPRIVICCLCIVGWPAPSSAGRTFWPGTGSAAEAPSVAEDSCSGTAIPNRMVFHKPGAALDEKIHHTETPISLDGGFKINHGPLGIEKYNDAALWAKLNQAGQPWSSGTVDTQFSLPNSTSKGWPTRTTALHDNFADGLDGRSFGLLKQKGSREQNVDVVTDVVNGVKKNVVRMKAESSGGRVTSAAVLQTADLFASGRYEVVARFPPVRGLVFAVWTFHYEHHFDPAHLPQGQEDAQFLPNMTGWESRTNHEIDIEMPASCSEMCPGGGCVGQYDTMNINAYVVTDRSGGMGPGYANLCVRAPEGTDFIDDKYHSYAFEWHSGSAGCDPRIDFFFDDKYIGTVDAFVPSRASRLVFGMWPGGSNWVSIPDWKEVYGYISEVNICPFNEDNDANFPQVFDQPFNHETIWELISKAPAQSGMPASTSQCPGAADKCTGDSDRPNGCSCGTDNRICATNCCNYDAVPGAINGTCAEMAVCTAECVRDQHRPFACECESSLQCGTGCCAVGVCATSESCEDPCARVAGRPAGCSCGLVGQCETGCCDFDAAPGPTNGICTSKEVCTIECEKSSKRPVGCGCQNEGQCGTGCCHESTCEIADSCPSPTKCAASANRPVGCECKHSWECVTNWCDGHCTDH